MTPKPRLSAAGTVPVAEAAAVPARPCTRNVHRGKEQVAPVVEAVLFLQVEKNVVKIERRGERVQPSQHEIGGLQLACVRAAASEWREPAGKGQGEARGGIIRRRLRPADTSAIACRIPLTASDTAGRSCSKSIFS